MSSGNEESKQKINALQAELLDCKSRLQATEQELHKYKSEVWQANERLEKLLSDLQTEYQLAAKIQRKLTPTQFPHIAGLEFSTKFIPGMQRGGDYFDIFELEDKLRFGIILASCTGYALSALFLSVLIKLESEIEAKRGLEPYLVIQKIAKEIATAMKPSDQASLFYGVVDRRNYELTYSSVGSILSFWQVRDQARIITLEPCFESVSTLLSKSPQEDSQLQNKIHLNSHDRLVLLTEGWAEAVSRLQDCPSPQEQKTWATKVLQNSAKIDLHGVRQELLMQSRSTSDESTVQRDQTILVMEVKDRVIKLAKK